MGCAAREIAVKQISLSVGKGNNCLPIFSLFLPQKSEMQFAHFVSHFCVSDNRTKLIFIEAGFLTRIRNKKKKQKNFDQ